MKTDSEDVAISMASQVDRLVCGELNETDRQQLLAWLEAEPGRWRLCGVAFLEAQAWSQAIERGPRTDEHSSTSQGANQCLSPPPSRTKRHSVVRQTGIAAAVVVAFGLGMASRELSVPAKHLPEPAVTRGRVTTPSDSDSVANSPTSFRHESVLASLSVETGGGFGRSTPIQFPVVPAATGESGEQQADIPDYERQKWERRGYKVSLDRRFLFAKLADGQQVVVPVEQLQVNPVPVHIN